MASNETATTKQCPACGGMNYPRADRCAVCGADLTPPLIKAPEPPQIAPQAQEAAPPPPPSPYFAPEEKKKEEPRPFVSTLFKSVVQDYLIPLAAGGGLVLLLISLGGNKEPPAQAGVSAAQHKDTDKEAQAAFMAYVLRNGPDRGKTMEQFWKEYVSAFQVSNRKGAAPAPVEVVFIQQATPGSLYNVFAVEKVPGEKNHIFPFQVSVEARSVMPAPACEFAPGTPPEYTGAICESSSAIFPEGL